MDKELDKDLEKDVTAEAEASEEVSEEPVTEETDGEAETRETEADDAEAEEAEGKKKKEKKEKKEKKGGKKSRTVLKVLIWIALCSTIFLIFAERWLLTSWSELSADEIIYHLRTSLGGTNPDMIWEFVLKSVVPTLIVIGVIVAAFFILRKKKPQWHRRIFIIMGIISICNVVGAITVLEVKTGLIRYAFRRMTMSDDVNEDFVYKNYVDPKTVDLKFPEKKRNLIYIYLESMEMTYADKTVGGGFEQGCIPELTKIGLDPENEDFSADDGTLNGGYILPGATWTMGAMFAHSTGLPLQIPIGGNEMTEQENFFPSVVGLGDILASEDYHQCLMIGSKATFGGRTSFYKQHGDFEICDYEWAIEQGKIDPDYKVWWGFEDEKLFSFAKEKILDMSKEDKPFNMTLLTVDTHFPDGYVCRLCGNEYGDDQYANVMACSSRQVEEFLNWAKQQDFYDNTTIVLIGDHTTMDADFCDRIDSGYRRKVFTSIINSPIKREKQTYRNYSTFDMFPTTLAALGVEIPGDRLGMGVNLYSDHTTLLEKYSDTECYNELSVPSSFVSELSQVKLQKSDLDKVKQKASVEISESENGKVFVHIDKIDVINYTALKKAELEVENTSTGNKRTYEMTAVQTNPNRFYCEVETNVNYSKKKAKNLKLTMYFTVDGIEHYPVVEYENGKKKK